MVVKFTFQSVFGARSRGVTRAVFYPLIWLAYIKTKGFTSRKSFCRSGSRTLFFGGREATTGNASAVRRLLDWLRIIILAKISIEKVRHFIFLSWSGPGLCLNHTVQKDSRGVLGTSFRFGPTLALADFGNSRKHPLWRLKRGENWNLSPEKRDLRYCWRSLRLLWVWKCSLSCIVSNPFINVLSICLVPLAGISTVCGPWSAEVPDALGPRLFRKWENISSRYRDLLISILSYDEVSAFLLRVKTRNWSLLTGRLICLSWSLDFCGNVNYMVMFT